MQIAADCKNVLLSFGGGEGSGGIMIIVRWSVCSSCESRRQNYPRAWDPWYPSSRWPSRIASSTCWRRLHWSARSCWCENPETDSHRKIEALSWRAGSWSSCCRSSWASCHPGTPSCSPMPWGTPCSLTWQRLRQYRCCESEQNCYNVSVRLCVRLHDGRLNDVHTTSLIRSLF